MSGKVELVYGPELLTYDHGPQHPLRPLRVLLTRELIAAYGLLDAEEVTETTPRPATDQELQLVHTERYVDAVKRAGELTPGELRQFGFGPGDNPTFPGMHEASAHVAGASLVAAEAVHSGRAEHAFSPAGGLHHAMPERASGFCVYDDPAIAMAWLLGQGVERVAYVDVDVHHGDGPQTIFYRDSRVLTISIHESGRFLFPGTGFVEERGDGGAAGTKVNVPLPPYTSDDSWLEAFHQVVPPLVGRWKPDVLVTQLGCDTHHTDPLAHLNLSTRAYREAAIGLHGLAHDAAGGRWLATGGGGYQWARVVPRAWTIYFAEMAGREIPDEIPNAWRSLAREKAGHPVPGRLSEPPPPGGDHAEVESIQEQVGRAVLDLGKSSGEPT
ncbi:MAG TPA: acetoin utilization protein AcuC [Actinomycetota bacterium]|nr:acetoin utilization protein AcuC [Actinomycetota bacterium]